MLTCAAIIAAARADDDPPLALARDGFFYVGGHTTTVNGHSYVVGQMYVEIRIPMGQTHPYPIIMVHGGTRTGTTYTGPRTGGRAGRSTSRGVAMPSTWWTSQDADALAWTVGRNLQIEVRWAAGDAERARSIVRGDGGRLMTPPPSRPEARSRLGS